MELAGVAALAWLDSAFVVVVVVAVVQKVEAAECDPEVLVGRLWIIKNDVIRKYRKRLPGSMVRVNNLGGSSNFLFGSEN